MEYVNLDTNVEAAYSETSYLVRLAQSPTIS